MPEPTTCARCGTAFGCGVADPDCWCAELRVSEAQRAELAGVYDGCLCPTCLRTVSEADGGGGEGEIGAPGFEPGTSPTRTVRATRLRHAPKTG
jgi:hypothetical protein